MSSDTIVYIDGISPRRRKRLEAKKRKIEAFLNLVNSEEEKETQMKKAKVGEEAKDRTIEEELKAIMDMGLQMKKKLREGEPTFHLSDHGLGARVNFKDNPSYQTSAPLFVEDIQHLLLHCIIGASSVKTRWCKLIRDRQLSHVVLLVIDGLSKNSVINNMGSFSKTLEIFSDVVEVITPDSYSLSLATELCGVHLSLGHRPTIQENNALGVCNSVKSLSSMFPTEDSSSSLDKNYSKLHLLLSPIQLVMENFPLPKSVFEGSKSDGYCFTKTRYTHVTANSPIYALDCEMCRMNNGKMEVTRIALMDEDFNVVYETLVKPTGVVSDYLTKYSGVTRKMLTGIETTLSDVQNKIQSILPADAILCGQSLNFDLHSLKMIHPYIIDTSVIYNISGCRSKKTSLKILSSTFLKESIQVSGNGHCPIEDCNAAMKLVQLKLKNGPQFGDAILSASNVFTKSKVSNNVSVPNKNATESKLSTSFFSKIQSQRKTACIVANTKSQSLYPEEMVPNTVKRVVKVNLNKIVKCAIKTIEFYDFTICHLDVSSDEKTSELCSSIDGLISKLHDKCPEKSLFVVVASGLLKKNEDGIYENALCMVTVKNKT